MDLNFDTALLSNYVSNSQKARILTEKWTLNNIYCPSCGDFVNEYANNAPVADFYCSKCNEDFELKSKSGKFNASISAGAYSEMIKRISSREKPNFFFLEYVAKLLNVNDFFVVPKHFIIKEIIEERKPLKETAKRAGWVGSNIKFSKIPKAGQIYYVEKGIEIPKPIVLEKWQKTVFLKKVDDVNAKGWILDIMNCIDSLNKKDFTLQNIYAFENDLSVIHPENKNIKPKIRQQLQFLRDKGYLEFIEAGKYRLR